MEIITTSKNNKYLYEEETGFLSLLCGDLCDNLKENKVSLIDEKKLKYLEKYGLINRKPISADKFRYLKTEDIEDAIFNTHQIIFEVTDRCNLKCRYCGYGDFYSNYDERLGKDMSFDTFSTLYDYFAQLWAKSSKHGSTYLRISFYGGEPLCNFALIEEAVNYVKNHPIDNKKIIYSMTTNAVLLDKYMDFLVENEFEMLISLDGNRNNDSYRMFKTGKTSFDKVVANVDRLYSKYPSYFKDKVNFNSVLHDRNSMQEADDFIYSRYGKHPMTNELNVFGIAKDKREVFLKMFHSKIGEYEKLENQDKVENLRFSPYLPQYEKWFFESPLINYSMNLSAVLQHVYMDNKQKIKKLPTKTCIPFSRKVFVTTSGKLFPCERIGNEFDFGTVSNGLVTIKFSAIVEAYNRLYDKYLDLCSACMIKKFCSVCIVSDLEGYKFCSEKNEVRSERVRKMVSFFEENAELYHEIMNVITIV